MLVLALYVSVVQGVICFLEAPFYSKHSYLDTIVSCYDRNYTQISQRFDWKL